MTVPVFRFMHPAVEEAAAMSGSNACCTLIHVTLRLAWQGILAASIFIFSIAFATLDVPAIIGWSNRVYTYSTYLLTLISSTGGMPEYGGVAALSAPMLI